MHSTSVSKLLDPSTWTPQLVIVELVTKFFSAFGIRSSFLTVGGAGLEKQTIYIYLRLAIGVISFLGAVVFAYGTFKRLSTLRCAILAGFCPHTFAGWLEVLVSRDITYFIWLSGSVSGLIRW